MYKEYNNIFDVVEMFSSREKVRDFFSYMCQAVIREAKRVDSSDDLEFYPVIYSKEFDTLSISFNYFVSCIAKFFDAGNKSAEELILKDLRILQTNINEDLDYTLHKNRSLIIINILQDFYGILHANNKRMNVTKLSGYITPKDSYFIPMVYENPDKKAIQYEVIPMKLSKLFDLGIEPRMVEQMKEIGLKANLKDVAYNQRNVSFYWSAQKSKTVLRYQD